MKLSDLKGDYVLLDFWGSWCGPCIGECPKVSTLYNHYHGKKFEGGGDFEVVGVAVETNEKRWQKAIDKSKALVGFIVPNIMINNLEIYIYFKSKYVEESREKAYNIG